MPIVVRRNRIRKNLQRQRRNRLGQTVIPETITEGGKKKRSRFAAHSGESEQNSSNDSSGRGLHYDVNDGLPPADPKRERGFAKSVRNEQDNFLGRTQD